MPSANHCHTRPLRLTIFADSDQFGGSERFILDLVARVDRDRFTPTIVTSEGLAADPRLWDADAARLALPLRRTGDAWIMRARAGASATPAHESAAPTVLYTERRPLVVAGLAAIRYRQAVHNFRLLRRALEDLAPDVIHINNGNYPGSESARLVAPAAKAATNTRVIHFVHGIPHAPRWPASVERRLDRQVDRATDRWVTGAHAASTALSVTRAIDPDRIQTVHLGQALPLDKSGPSRAEMRARLGIDDRHLLLLAVGALEPVKGHAIALTAMEELRRSHSHISARLLIAGTGPLEHALRAESLRRGVNDSVDFLGWRTDVADLLAASDLLVLPSIGMEQMPFAIKEAMAHGVPVIASAVGGVPELVDDGDTGFLVPSGDGRAMARAIAMAGDHKLREKLSRASVDRIRTKFDPAHAVRMLEALYAGD